jgi:hypothetical protein
MPSFPVLSQINLRLHKDQPIHASCFLEVGDGWSGWKYQLYEITKRRWTSVPFDVFLLHWFICEPYWFIFAPILIRRYLMCQPF